MRTDYAAEVGVSDTITKLSWIQTRKLQKLIIHPSFDNLYKNDIAMIKLDV